jgi:hypothetical protein
MDISPRPRVLMSKREWTCSSNGLKSKEEDMEFRPAEIGAQDILLAQEVHYLEWEVEAHHGAVNFPAWEVEDIQDLNITVPGRRWAVHSPAWEAEVIQDITSTVPDTQWVVLSGLGTQVEVEVDGHQWAVLSMVWAEAGDVDLHPLATVWEEEEEEQHDRLPAGSDMVPL